MEINQQPKPKYRIEYLTSNDLDERWNNSMQHYASWLAFCIYHHVKLNSTQISDRVQFITKIS